MRIRPLNLAIVAGFCLAMLAACSKPPVATVAQEPAPAKDATVDPTQRKDDTRDDAKKDDQVAQKDQDGPRSDADKKQDGDDSGDKRPDPRPFKDLPDLKPVYFEFDKYDIRPEDTKILETNAAWLKTNTHLVLIEGHCDERGTNEYNLVLGERRAKAAMTYLVAQGVQASRITILTYGEERPICSEQTESCWSKNRRALFLVNPR